MKEDAYYTSGQFAKKAHALGGKNYRNQQFVRVVIMQLGLRYGAVFPEPGEYLFITFFLSHRNLFLSDNSVVVKRNDITKVLALTGKKARIKEKRV